MRVQHTTLEMTCDRCGFATTSGGDDWSMQLNGRDLCPTCATSLAAWFDSARPVAADQPPADAAPMNGSDEPPADQPPAVDQSPAAAPGDQAAETGGFVS